MNKLTDMIRSDNAQVMRTFRNYRADSTPRAKQALVNTVSLSLETLGQLKAEIFYPALRTVAAAETALTKNEAGQQQMHSLIGQLRDMRSTATRYDDTVMALMQSFIHNVADEESLLLPLAERLPQDQLGELGSKMGKRRLALATTTMGKKALNFARTRPASTLLMTAGSLVAGGLLIKRALDRRA